MVLLKSSRPDGKCFVETAELDGETNLKIRKARPNGNGNTQSHHACARQHWARTNGAGAWQQARRGAARAWLPRAPPITLPHRRVPPS